MGHLRPLALFPELGWGLAAVVGDGMGWDGMGTGMGLGAGMSLGARMGSEMGFGKEPGMTHLWLHPW